jgi:hypothetical protein
MGGVALLWKLSGRWMVPMEGMGGLGIHLIAGLILAVVLLQHPLPPQHKVPRTTERVVLSIAVMAAVLGLAVTLNRVSPWTASITLVLAAALGAYRFRSVPETFLLAADDTPGEVQEREEIRREWEALGTAGRSGGLAYRWFLDATIWRSLLVGIKLKQAPWFSYPFLLFFGAFMSGLDGRWIEDSLRFNYVWMAAYMLMAFTMHPPKQIYLIDGLPISRRRILDVMTLPLMVVLLVGYGVGSVTLGYLDRAHPKQMDVVHLIKSREDGNYYIRVPFRALRVAWDGHVPENVAPWGEAHKAWTGKPLVFLPVKLYSPYSTPPGSSIDFVAWQLSRAVEAVYGAQIAPDEIKGRYLRERTDGGAELIPDKLHLEADYPYLRPIRKPGPVLPVVMGLSFAIWMLALAVYFQAFRAGISNARRMMTAFGVLALMMLGWLAVVFGPIVRRISGGYFNGGLTAALRQAGESPVATAAVWITMIAVSLASYRLALWRFRNAEAIRESKDTPKF